ncbi:MAG: hypothetical protein HY897_24970 [Deltaproteobacteria bacterium]|nr:hypothetical protein [Deltaproteobacteria bacterium]
MNLLQEIREKWREGRLGFKMDEVMTGAHWFEPGCGPDGNHTDTGRLVSRSLSHFKILDAPSFVKSLRWA